jgi:crotonobetainyl-CoA:carnitine CoA-transferase CaiB-like acyl-CoA transferase
MYDLLEGIRVLEVAIAAPSGLGAHLAELGAEVIKIEKPPGGDTTRKLRDGGFINLLWNRGKQSVGMDLAHPEARAIALDLAKQADVFVDGLRAGTVGSFGLDYEAVRAVKPGIVYCSLSGMGQTGPYRRLGTHAPGFDAFAGISHVAFREDGLPYLAPHTSVGVHAGILTAAFAVTAALVKAARTGQGQYIDVAEIDAAALWRSLEITRGLNRGWDTGGSGWGASDAVRGQVYETSDGKYVVFQPFEEKFWQNFCRAIDRPDLGARSSGAATELARGDEQLRAELAAIMKTKTQREWIDFFIEHNVPGMPMHVVRDLVEDPHFLARDNLATLEDSQLGRLTVPTTPIKLPDQTYELQAVPEMGQHTNQVLSELLGYDKARLAGLRERGVIHQEGD